MIDLNNLIKIERKKKMAKDWYYKQIEQMNRLIRLNKPKWMLDIDDKFKAIRNSRRRHTEKLNKLKKFTET